MLGERDMGGGTLEGEEGDVAEREKETARETDRQTRNESISVPAWQRPGFTCELHLCLHIPLSLSPALTLASVPCRCMACFLLAFWQAPGWHSKQSQTCFLGAQNLGLGGM